MCKTPSVWCLLKTSNQEDYLNLHDLNAYSFTILFLPSSADYGCSLLKTDQILTRLNQPTMLLLSKFKSVPSAVVSCHFSATLHHLPNPRKLQFVISSLVELISVHLITSRSTAIHFHPITTTMQSQRCMFYYNWNSASVVCSAW